MRRIVCAILVLIIAFLPCGYARPPKTETVGEYTYSYIDWFYGVSGISGGLPGKWELAISPMPIGELTLPSTLGGCPVTSIGMHAFEGCTELTSVTIPEGVKAIMGQAFAGCINLERVTMPPAVAVIREGAFSGCRSLRNITIPESVTLIGANAFVGTAIWSEHPDGVVYVDGWACGYKGNKPSGRLVFQEGTRGIAEHAFERCDGVTEVVIPKGVKVIGEGAFLNCRSLADVTIPSTVTSIGSFAFAGCNGLTSVVIPEGVTTIRDGVFSDCLQLRRVKIPDSVTSLGRKIVAFTPIYDSFPMNRVIYHDGWVLGCKHEYGEPARGALAGNLVIKNGTRGIADQAFDGFGGASGLGKGLTSVTIPPSVRVIGRMAFSGSENLTSVTIQSRAATIGECAFNQCRKLAKLTILPGTISIGDSAFSECANLVDVVIPEGVTSIERSAFFECTNLKRVTLPSSVTFIGDSAFYACSNLTSVVIPEGVTSIGERVFSKCHRLASVTLPSSLTNIGEFAFAATSLTSITIPASVTQTGRRIFYKSSLLREALFLGDAPRADEIYSETPEALTTYVLPDSTGWDGNFNSTTLPKLWEDRNIMHLSNDPLVAAKAPLGATAADADFHAWLNKFFPDSKGDYGTLAGKRGANGIPVWDSYVAGLDPTDPKSRFRAFITMKEGSPIITWEPRLRDRVYTVVGKESLNDTADWGRTNSLTRFFKVRVELPAK